MPISFILIAALVVLMYGFWSWADKSGRERKEQGKPNWLRPIIVAVVGAMALMVLWAVMTGN